MSVGKGTFVSSSRAESPKRIASLSSGAAGLREKKIHVELKSLNSKAMDLSVRIAPLYREKEMEIRTLITKALERGKVDFSLWVEKEAAEMATPINAALMNNYYEQFKNIAQTTDIPMPTDLFATLLRMPDVLTKVDIQELGEGF